MEIPRTYPTRKFLCYLKQLNGHEGNGTGDVQAQEAELIFSVLIPKLPSLNGSLGYHFGA